MLSLQKDKSYFNYLMIYVSQIICLWFINEVITVAEILHLKDSWGQHPPEKDRLSNLLKHVQKDTDFSASMYYLFQDLS